METVNAPYGDTKFTRTKPFIAVDFGNVSPPRKLMSNLHQDDNAIRDKISSQQGDTGVLPSGVGHEEDREESFRSKSQRWFYDYFGLRTHQTDLRSKKQTP